MNTKWMGLWAQERQAFYAGQVIKKEDIPKYTRIVLRYNKFYKKDSNRPRFVYCFADSEGYESKCVSIETEDEKISPYYDDEKKAYFTGDGKRLYTEKEAQRAIDCSVCDALGHDGQWNVQWMCFLYEIEGKEGVYCKNCADEIMLQSAIDAEKERT